MTKFVTNKVVCQDFWPEAAGRPGQLKSLEVCELWEASLSCFKNQNYHLECKKLLALWNRTCSYKKQNNFKFNGQTVSRENMD